MPEFFTLVSPEEAREKILAYTRPISEVERVQTSDAVGRFLAADMIAPHPLPEFRRSTVDGYALKASETFGASDTLPAYLPLIGEVPMGREAEFTLEPGTTALVHTGGSLPDGADAVVMIEDTQLVRAEEIEVTRAVAVGDNLIEAGEDIKKGDVLLKAGHRLRAGDLGGLMAIGMTAVDVIRRPRVAVFATGDEVIPSEQQTQPGQVRDINSTTIAALAEKAGALTERRGILPDHFDAILAAVKKAIDEGADMVVLSAGSSVSVRDLTARVFDQLGEPGVLVHGIATKPGKPTILGAGDGVILIGLPGNPVSAFIQFLIICMPVLYQLQGGEMSRALFIKARLGTNLASMAGREDYVPAKISERDGELWAEPIFFKSNLIFKIVEADGLIRVPLDATGITRGEWVEIRPLEERI